MYEPTKRVVIYGPPKSWKTSSLATVPRGWRVWLADIDRKAAGLIERWHELKHRPEDLTIMPIKGGRTLMGGRGEVIASPKYDSLRATLDRAPKGYDLYALDSYTTASLLITHKVCGTIKRVYEMRQNVELRGQVTDIWWEFADQIESYGAWLITTCHESWQTIEDGLSEPDPFGAGKARMLVPDIASGARVTIPANCDFVLHTETSRATVDGKSRTIVKWRTKLAPFIMAASVGHESKLTTHEPADLTNLFTKCGLLKGGAKRPAHPAHPQTTDQTTNRTNKEKK